MAGADDSTRDTGGARFPSTIWSELVAPGGVAPADRSTRVERLAQRYWRPIYAHIRLRWQKPREEARDLTQEFFVKLLEQDVLRDVKPGPSRFRTFVRTVLDNFIRDQERFRTAQKRGGGGPVVSLSEQDLDLADRRVAAGGAPEDALDREWRRSVLEAALERLDEACARDGAPHYARAVRRYYVDSSGTGPPTYEAIARELGVAATDVTNYLNRGRTRLREIVVELVQETVTDPEALRLEMGELFGEA